MNPRIDHLASADRLRGEAFDLVVIGGGITGAGVAWRAAGSGSRVALVEAADFASGTSSRSTKLIHGGLRYLAQGEISLVKKAARERHVVHRLAPHLAEQRWMLLPTASWATAWKHRIGVSLYETLGRVPRPMRHRHLDAARLKAEEPLLNGQVVDRGSAFTEFLTDDARLVMAVARAAVREGAVIARDVRALRPVVQGLEVSDANGTFTIRADRVINATGPWVESLPGVGENRLTLSRGVHIAVDRTRLPVNSMLMLEANDGRPVFVIARGAVTYIGTTDVVQPELERWPVVTGAEVDYLLATVAHYARCHGGALRRTDVVSSWAGLRPLIRQEGKDSTELSRKDEIWIADNGMVTVAGGKLTGFRQMADAVLAAVGVFPSRPKGTLPGGDLESLAAAAQSLQDTYPMDMAEAVRLVRLYGSEAADVLSLGSERLADGVWNGEVRWAVSVEGALTLEDVVYRRLGLAYFQPRTVPKVMGRIADEMSEMLRWTSAVRQGQLQALRARIAADLSFRPDVRELGSPPEDDSELAIDAA